MVERAVVLNLDDDQFAGAALAYAGGGIRGWWVTIGQPDQRSIELLEAALTRLGEADGPQRARLLVSLAKELVYQPATDERRGELAGEAVAMARRISDPASIAVTLIEAILARFSAETASERVESAREAHVLAASLNDDQLAGHAALHAAVALAELDRIPESMSAFEQAGSLLAPLRDPGWRVIEPAFRAGSAICEGRFGDARRLINETFQNAQEQRDPNALLTFAGGLVTMRVFEGFVDDLLDVSADAVRSFPVLADMFETFSQALLPLSRAPRADVQAALDSIQADLVGSLKTDLFRLYALCGAARGAWRMRHEATARNLYDALAPFAGHNAFGGQHRLGAGVAVGRMVLHGARKLRTGGAPLRRRDRAVCSQRMAGAGGGGAHRLGGDAGQATRPRRLRPGQGPPRRWGRRGPRHRDGGGAGRGRGGPSPAWSDVSAGPRPLPDGGEPGAPSGRRAGMLRDRAKTRLTARRASRHRPMDARSDTDEELVRRFGSAVAQRATFAAMARAFQPARAHGLTGDVVFVLETPDRGIDMAVATDSWTVAIGERRAGARRGGSDDPLSVLQLGLADFVRLGSGEVNAVELILDNRLQVSGDVVVAIRLPDLFGLSDAPPPGIR